MIKTLLHNLEKKGFMRKRRIVDSDILNYDLNQNLPFAVVREDGKLIRQFNNLPDASKFSSKLNHSYEENGIKANSKVIKTSDFYNVN